MKKIPIILDTDIGGDIDDTWALLMLLKMPIYDVRLITIFGYDTKYQAELTAKLLTLAGKDIIPIAFNEPKDYNRGPQSEWVGDFNIERYKGKVYRSTCTAMVHCIKESNEPITILALAASTNIAELLQCHPDIIDKCNLVSMLGSIQIGYNGVLTPEVETNVRLDIPACKSVLTSPMKQCIIPLDACGQIIMRDELYRELQQTNDELIQALLENYRVWWEHCDWNNKNQKIDQESSVLFDVGALMFLYQPSLFFCRELQLIITEEGYTKEADCGKLVLCATGIRDYDKLCKEIVNILLCP
jgi:inosine-uridine nucleoside N-ribohydrolase